jgi:hypothetical protein
VLGLSWLFYYAQRSGKLSSGRNPIPWRGDSHLNDRVPGQRRCHRLLPVLLLPSCPQPAWRPSSRSWTCAGGFYDAGDHLKLNFPLATSLSFLAWGVLEFPAAYAATAQTGVRGQGRVRLTSHDTTAGPPI